MDRFLRLKELGLLEQFQVDLYRSRMDALQDEFVRHVYLHMIEVEEKHAAFLRRALEGYGQELPILSGDRSQLAGSFLGNALDWDAPENHYRLGAALESKAVEMYRAFIDESGLTPDFQEKLWDFLVEEEFHRQWFMDNMDKAQRQNQAGAEGVYFQVLVPKVDTSQRSHP